MLENTGRRQAETMLAVAKTYRDAGLSVIPIAAGSKLPVGKWKLFETQLMDDAELERRYLTPYNGRLPDRLGVIGGAISGGLEMLDFDVGGLEWDTWHEHVPSELFVKLLIERTPSGGYHVAYRCENAEANQGLCYRLLFDEKKQKHVWKATIETRGEGGFCVVAPSDGYTLILGDWLNVPIISQNERNLLIDVARTLNQKPKESVTETLPSVDRPGDLFNCDPQTPLTLLRLLLRHGWTLDHETAEQWFLKHPGNQSREHSTTLSKTSGFLHTFSPNTPFEQGKNVPPFEVFAVLETNGDFTKAASMLAENGFMQPIPNIDLSGILSQSQTPEKKEDDHPFKIWTCPELMRADLKQEFLIENVLVEGQPCIIGGPKKCLKTSIMLDMAVSLATGVSFLRRFEVPVPKRVLVMSGESGLVTIRNTIRRIADSADLEPEEIDNLFICDRVPRLDNISHITILKKTLEDFHPDVVVFDPAYLMLTTDKPESLFATGGQLSAISLLCQIHGATIIIAHHNSKSSNVLGRTPDLDDLSWSGFAEFARQWILVSRNKAYDPMTGDQHIKMVVGGSYGHGGEYDIHIQEGDFPDRRWNVEMMDLNGIVGQTARKPIAERKEEERRKRILKVLAQSDDSVSKTQIVKLSGVNNYHVSEIVGSLVTENIVEECRTNGSRGPTTSGYRLVHASP